MTHGTRTVKDLNGSFVEIPFTVRFDEANFSYNQADTTLHLQTEIDGGRTKVSSM